VQTNLVSDDIHFTPAQVQDPNLVNPWGLAASPTGAWWVANEGTGTSTLYNTSNPTASVVPLVVNVPPAAPTGIVYNGGGGFNVSENGTTGSSVFVFATAAGTICGWNPGVDPTNGIVAVPSQGGLYLGLAIATNSHGDSRLYAADFLHNTIDVYDQNFQPVTSLPGNFTDSQLPGNYHAFNIQAINNRLYVEYAPADKVLAGTADPGDGAIDVYNADGQLQQRLVLPHDTHLNQPWAVAIASPNFGKFSNDLLVGEFGNGHISAFNPHNGRFVGELTDTNDQPIAIRHLWGLAFGNGGAAGPTNTLYFTAGLTSHLAPGNDPFHGLFGSLRVARNDEAMMGMGSLPLLVSNNSVGNFSSQHGPPLDERSQMTGATKMVQVSDRQAMDQPINTLFGTDGNVSSQESRPERVALHLSTFIPIDTADTNFLESMVVDL
jgi:uncharacterized protein (TIGR03118 family)